MKRGRLIKRMSFVLVGAAAAVALASVPAGAHIGRPTNGFAEGFLHPILGPDHLLAMLAVGVVASSAARFAWWLAPVAFLAGMLAGASAGLSGWQLPAAEPLILTSVIALGLVAAGAIGRPGLWLIPLLIIAGMAHGNAHGLVAPATARPAIYVGGFLLGTALLHLAGIAGGRAIRRRPHLRIAIGGLTTLTGMLLLAG